MMSGLVGELLARFRMLARGSKRPTADTKFDVRANSQALYEINQPILISSEFVQTIDEEAEAEETCASLAT